VVVEILSYKPLGGRV